MSDIPGGNTLESDLQPLSITQAIKGHLSEVAIPLKILKVLNYSGYPKNYVLALATLSYGSSHLNTRVFPLHFYSVSFR